MNGDWVNGLSNCGNGIRKLEINYLRKKLEWKPSKNCIQHASLPLTYAAMNHMFHKYVCVCLCVCCGCLGVHRRRCFTSRRSWKKSRSTSKNAVSSSCPLCSSSKACEDTVSMTTGRRRWAEFCFPLHFCTSVLPLPLCVCVLRACVHPPDPVWFLITVDMHVYRGIICIVARCVVYLYCTHRERGGAPVTPGSYVTRLSESDRVRMLLFVLVRKLQARHFRHKARKDGNEAFLQTVCVYFPFKTHLHAEGQMCEGERSWIYSHHQKI